MPEKAFSVCIKDSVFIDPCSGSGHILAYMFDVLMKIYESYGYTTREAVASIVENNLYGLDIDDRAAQLAYFAVMMKARQYDRRFFSRGIQPHVYAIAESNHVDSFALEYFCNGDAKLKKAMDTIISELHDAKEYGSIITVSQQEWSALYDRFAEITEDINMSRETALRELLPLVQVAEALAQKYDTVVTNPPYMGSSGMSAKLTDFVKKNYPDSKSDLFSCFIEHGNGMIKRNRFNCMVTMQSWMFLSSFEKMRAKALRTKTITNLMHMENMVMGIAFGTAVTVFRNNVINGYKGTYNQIKLQDIKNDTPKQFPIHENRFAQVSTDNFSKIPGSPIAYWLSTNMVNDFSLGTVLKENGDTRQGMATSDNNRFLRLWTEVSNHSLGLNCASAEDAIRIHKKWYPYNKGGEFRKWYGNIDYVINYEDDGLEVKAYATSLYKTATRTIKSMSEYFKPCLSWSKISSGSIAFRYYPQGFIFDVAGCCIFYKNDEIMKYHFGFINSNVAKSILAAISPTLNYEAGHIASLPVISDERQNGNIIKLVDANIEFGKEDWDSFETSWDFVTHPFITYRSGAGYADIPMNKWQYRIADAYHTWESNATAQFDLLKKNEEELNRIFIDIYGLQDELTPEVEDKDVTVRKADLGRDIRSFISYAVGCMFGRYSLDVDGLAYAGGEWDNSKYSTFAADKDNIIPISDDEYFEDDIVGRFVKFVEVVYGKDTLDENLKFIADALGGKGQPKDVIRNYFLNDFYSDHCKIYQKRPIYWLFDSGKKNGFKALIYMHRYQPDTIARIRTDYVHEQQARYRTAIADLETRITNASTGERVKLNKQLKTLNDQATEIHEYEEKIHHLADQMISIDLDDGVKVNYAKFQDVLAKIK